jgi:hypothetical protein
MKKFRGQKRYYKRLNNLKDLYKFNIDDSYDNYHIHIDFGFGNLSWKHRKSHLLSLFELFNCLKYNFASRKEEYQLFCYIIINGSNDDAIYIHTKNANIDNFPIKHNDYKIDYKLPYYYEDLLNKSKLNWYKTSWYYESEPYYGIIVYDINYGISTN